MASPSDEHSPAINWPKVLDENSRWIRSVLRSRVSDPHVVDDLMQELALAVVRQPSRPTDPERVAPWLYRLAVRQAINHHRRTGRRKRLMERFEHDSGRSENGGVADVDALDWLVRTELNTAVRAALMDLDPRDREVLVLKYTEDWSYADLSKHLGVSLGTIEYRLIRAKKALRQRLVARELAPL